MTTPVSADVTGVVVARIRPRTAAAAAGLTRGDRVLAINGHRLRDAIDFQFHAREPELELRAERAGTLSTLPLERRGADLRVQLQLPPTPLSCPPVSAGSLPRLGRLAKAGIRMHAQIVLCPGWNDGPQLERTVFDLAPLHPKVATTAIVPVGLTRHRERLPALRSL